ncbi:GntR family transcriptional regulator [Lysinibacillus sp. FSL K6-3209]|uniref:GntR family transcriptional regulator n=1 Tax=Lysinibacillus sp. FSL K6-3209 TaxID=2921497 RepID=UPI0030DD7C42
MKYVDEQELVVKEYLLQEIEAGNYSQDGKMPSEHTLIEMFGVPRIKVRNAYDLLEKMGLIYSQKGIGRFLREKQKPLEVVMSGDISFSEKMLKFTSNYQSVVTKMEQVPKEHLIFSKPYVQHSDLYLIERLRFIDEEPAAIHRSYVVVENMPAIKQVNNALSSIYTFYQQHGVKQFRSSFSHLAVKFPNELDRTLLACEILVPLVKVESDSWDDERNVLLEYTEIVYRTDRFFFQI